MCRPSPRRRRLRWRNRRGSTIFPLTVGAFADSTYVLNGRVDELALYRRLLTADERAWLHNSGQGRAYSDLPAPQLPPGLSLVYDYSDPAHAHAVTALGGNSYAYDANGNMITRTVSGQTYTLAYDAENRLVSVTGAKMIAEFTHDGDGKRVKSAMSNETILFVGAHYEVKNGSEITKYYFAGASRIASRACSGTTCADPTYTLTDHLGSTSLTTDSNGAKIAELRYTACPLRGCFAREKCAILGAARQPTILTPVNTATSPILDCIFTMPASTTLPWDASPRLWA